MLNHVEEEGDHERTQSAALPLAHVATAAASRRRGSSLPHATEGRVGWDKAIQVAMEEAGYTSSH